MAVSTNEVQREMDRIKSDLRSLRDDISDVSRASGRAASEQVRETAENVQEQGKEVASKAREQVSENPVTSVATAFGVGALVGWLVSRS